MSELPSQKYLVQDQQGNVYGPAEAAMLREWVQQGRIVAGMHIAPRETREWVEVSVHPALADLFPGQSAPQSSITPTPNLNSPQYATPDPSPAPITPQPTWTPAEVTRVSGASPNYESTLPYAATGIRNHPLALTSMIVGIAGFLFAFGTCIPICGCISGPFSGLAALTAIVLGSIGLMQIKAASDRFTGKGMALAGIILGVCTLCIFVLFLIIGIFANFAPGARPGP